MERKTLVTKVPGGKLLRLNVEMDEGSIVRINLTGDFFFHPEEGLQDLEKYLSSMTLEELVNGQERIESFMRDNGLQAIGFSPRDIVYLMRCMRC